MKKLTSYQKLKLENKRLKNDIYKLVKKWNMDAGIQTKLKYTIMYDNEEVMWFGDSTKN